VLGYIGGVLIGIELLREWGCSRSALAFETSGIRVYGSLADSALRRWIPEAHSSAALDSSSLSISWDIEEQVGRQRSMTNIERAREGLCANFKHVQPLTVRLPAGTVGVAPTTDYAFSPTCNSATLKGTPHPPIPQYPSGFFARYCW
jgi:hypothetical protein